MVRLSQTLGSSHTAQPVASSTLTMFTPLVPLQLKTYGEAWMLDANAVKAWASAATALVETFGKGLWIVIAGFIALAVATGSQAMLGTVRDRLVTAGVTVIKTPAGDIDLSKIGKLAQSSEALGINAAVAREFAASAPDGQAKRALEASSVQLVKQQQVLLDAVRSLSRANLDSQTATAEAVERWLFLGRRSGDHWAPLSFSLGDVQYPVKAGAIIQVKSEALLYDTVDCGANAAAPADAKPSKQVEFIRPTATGVAVVDAPTECNSAGSGSTVWAKVSVPGGLLLTH